MIEPAEIETRLMAVRERIATAAARSHRSNSAIRLVLASKTQPAAAIIAAYDAGAREFGENYVQEAVEKRSALPMLNGVTWHMIGHLQTNKARLAVDNFDVIQTLDSARLAAAIARARPSPPFVVLIEVNLGGEASKSGVAPVAVEQVINAVRGQVEVCGLMTIPPAVAQPELARPWFAQLRELRDRLATTTGLKLSELSMGMTEDFEIAIEEGATIVRVGRAVFGERKA